MDSLGSSETSAPAADAMKMMVCSFHWQVVQADMMVMPGDNVTITVTLIVPIAMDEGLFSTLCIMGLKQQLKMTQR